MTLIRTIGIGLLTTGVLVVASGCATLLQPSGPLQNYTQLEGTEATHPAFIDGDLQTIGETAFPQSEGTSRIGVDSPPTEAYILLPDVFTINALRIHAETIRGIDVVVEDPNQGWKLYERIDGLSGPIINVKMKGIVRASGIKIRVRSTTEDAAVRQKNMRTDRRGFRYVTGETRATAPIAEIEVLGPPTTLAQDADDEAPSPIDDEIGAILRGDLGR